MNDSRLARTVLVTGATDRISLATARQLAAARWRALLRGRSRAQGESAARQIAQSTQNPTVEFVEADFSSLDEVRRCGGSLCADLEPMAVLVNTFEATFAVNHPAPRLLTRPLLPLLQKSAPSRIINVSSAAHTRGRLDVEDLQMEHRNTPYGAYATSKLANVLFTHILLREGFPGSAGSDVRGGASTSVYLAPRPVAGALRAGTSHT